MIIMFSFMWSCISVGIIMSHIDSKVEGASPLQHLQQQGRTAELRVSLKSSQLSMLWTQVFWKRRQQ